MGHCVRWGVVAALVLLAGPGDAQPGPASQPAVVRITNMTGWQVVALQMRRAGAAAWSEDVVPPGRPLANSRFIDARVPAALGCTIDLEALVRNPTRQLMTDRRQIARLDACATGEVVLGDRYAAIARVQPDTLPATPVFFVNNHSGHIVHQLYVRAPGETKWSTDRLGRGVLPPGERFALSLPQPGCRVDVALVLKVDGTSPREEIRQSPGFDACSLGELAIDADLTVTGTPRPGPGRSDTADAPTTGYERAPVQRLSFVGTSCTPHQRAELHRDFVLAAAQIRHAIGTVTREPEDPVVAHWFRDASRRQLLASLRATERFLADPSGLPIACEPQASTCAIARQSGRYLFAYVLPIRVGGSDPYMGFCELYWQRDHTGRDSRPGTVVHEGSHWAASTGDFDYGIECVLDSTRNDPIISAETADALQYFMESLFATLTPKDRCTRPRPRP